MSVQANVRVYGAKKGSPGVRVIERSGVNALQDPRYGTTFMLGLLKRGPMGVPIPFSTQADYMDICGDPRDATWHLFRDGSHLLPDAIDGFYRTGGGAGQLWLIRLDLDGKAKKAERTFKNSLGADCLKVSAANEGRWGGQYAQISSRPIIYATINTFTLVAPGTLANQYIGAVVEFSNETGKRYEIVANTESAPSGEVVFTVAAQYSLIADNVTGPSALTGTATYERYTDLDGAVSFPLLRAVSGNVSINNRVITGVGTAFTTDLKTGSNIYYQGEARVVESVTSDTTATINEPFTTAVAASATVQVDNLTVTGTGTTFTDLSVGDMVYAMIGGQRQGRTIADIDSDTELALSSGFTEALSSATLEVDNFTVIGTGTQFTSELQVGSYLVDPNRAGAAVRVESVDSATSLTISTPFGYNFTDAVLTKQSLSATVTLEQIDADGLAVELGLGTKYPQTHFSINVYFNGSLVYQVPDASLDANDPRGLFVENVVNDDGRNIAYRTGSSNYQKWITVENLWASAYTTNQAADVRPMNGSGKVLALTNRRIYTVAQLDYQGAIGKLLYPNPYLVARSYVRVTDAAAPVELQGTVSSTGVAVTGTSTNFLATLKVGDYLYDAESDTVRKIRAIASNTGLTLESAFPSNLPALSKVMKAGYLEGGQGYDLSLMTSVNARFTVSFPESLQGGYDGNLAGLIPYYWTKFFDIDENLIENAVWGKNAGLVKLACPGVSDTVVQKAGAFYAEESAFEFHAEIPSNYASAATAEVFLNQFLGRNDFQTVSFPSYAFISSPFGAGDRMVSLTGDILGGEASQAVISEGYHVPFAGVNATLPRIIKLPYEAKPQDEAILNLAGIQIIKKMFGNTVVWGARSTAISSLYDFAHIRRTQSNYIRLFLEARELLQLMFKPNQPLLLDQVIMVLNNFARRENRKGVFTQYLTFRQAVEIRGANTTTGVIADENTAVGLVEVINGKLHVYFSYVPTGVVEELAINCNPDILTSQYGNALAGSLL